MLQSADGNTPLDIAERHSKGVVGRSLGWFTNPWWFLISFPQPYKQSLHQTLCFLILTDRERSGDSARTEHPSAPNTGQKKLQDILGQPQGRVKGELAWCLSAETWQAQGIQQALKDSVSGQSKSIKAQVIINKQNKQWVWWWVLLSTKLEV